MGLTVNLAAARVRRAFLTGALLVLLCGASLAAPQPAASTAQATVSLPASAPAYAGLPLQRDDGPGASGGLSWGLQLVLAGAVAAVLAGVYQLRRRQMSAAQGSPALRSLQALRLAQGVSLHVVHWGDEELLLACTAAGVTVVSRRPPPAGKGTDSPGSGAA